jgi:hypothetical protein
MSVMPVMSEMSIMSVLSVKSTTALMIFAKFCVPGWTPDHPNKKKSACLMAGGRGIGKVGRVIKPKTLYKKTVQENAEHDKLIKQCFPGPHMVERRE